MIRIIQTEKMNEQKFRLVLFKNFHCSISPYLVLPCLAAILKRAVLTYRGYALQTS